MVKNVRLDKNHEFPELTEKYREPGRCCPGDNYDECKRGDDDRHAGGDEYEQMREQAQSH
ncbi:MAG: hypothetical protein HDR11_06795 [Lachnospiraceae bacterium]|nr:hypothetical protein [Lachnospiraceae bacterium]